MRRAETVLTIISERGKRNLPLGQSYRQLYNPSLYLHSYDQIQRNHGAMTKGIVILLPFGRHKEDVYTRVKTDNFGDDRNENL